MNEYGSTGCLITRFLPSVLKVRAPSCLDRHPETLYMSVPACACHEFHRRNIKAITTKESEASAVDADIGPYSSRTSEKELRLMLFHP